MDVQQGLLKPFQPSIPFNFGLYKPNSGGGGWVRTSDARLMSSWPSGLPSFGADRR
jgi:hypothetical protein